MHRNDGRTFVSESLKGSFLLPLLCSAAHEITNRCRLPPKRTVTRRREAKSGFEHT
jgi:hypothetical protein